MRPRPMSTVTFDRFLQGAATAPADAVRSGTSQGRVSLEIYFVGGTVFRKSDSNYIAVQLSGRGVKHGSHPMAHRSFLVARATTFGSVARPFPSGYETKLLHPHLTGSPADWEAVCLVGKDVVVHSVGGPPVKYRAMRVAHYGAVAAHWVPTKHWDPSNPAINSRFTLTAGHIDDAHPVNTHGAAANWSIGGGPHNRKLSDVAKLDLSADKVTIGGIGTTPFEVPSGPVVRLYVFSGPEASHTHGKYRKVTHALMLKTVFDVKGTSDDDIMPTADADLDAYDNDLPHPCDFGAETSARTSRVKAPPDSEFCANYQELP